jgi:ribosomal protein S18 acetylase RimI-like enzyme
MLNYREAKESDIVAICELGEEVNAVHHHAFPQIFAGPGERDRDAAHWLNGISKPDAITFVAEESESILGFVNVSIVNETHSLLKPLRFGRVGSLSVTENRRGQGIGRELMIRAQEWVTSRGGTEVRLNVWAFNTRALRMYEELGYETRSLFLAKELPSGA